VLRVDVLNGSDIASLRGYDHLLDVRVVDRPGRAAFVIGDDEELADAAVVEAQRLELFARYVAGVQRPQPEPAVLREHDPSWLTAGRRLLRRIGRATAEEALDDGTWTYDHIGSTAVSGLRAKRFIDLQVGVSELPEVGSAFDAAMSSLGYLPESGARPDSPGVYQDMVSDPSPAPERMYRKRLYVRPDPRLPSILHVRLVGAPFWSYPVLFRDWLRIEPEARKAYEAMKERAAAEHATDADCDDYTRAKMGFFDEVREQYERAGRVGRYRVRRW
jgi:dephospho-CoA kinase